MKKKSVSNDKIIRKQINWQTGEYARAQEFSIYLPTQFLLLCKLVDISPQNILLDFMDNLAHATWKREGRDLIKSYIRQYFIAHGYGQKFYTENEISQMFTEMDAIGMLFPKDCANEFQDMHVEWREAYLKYWFEKWYFKNQRK